MSSNEGISQTPNTTPTPKTPHAKPNTKNTASSLPLFFFFKPTLPPLLLQTPPPLQTATSRAVASLGVRRLTSGIVSLGWRSLINITPSITGVAIVAATTSTSTTGRAAAVPCIAVADGVAIALGYGARGGSGTGFATADKEAAGFYVLVGVWTWR